MNKLLILGLVLTGSHLFSQDLSTTLKTSKWFAFAKGKTIFYSKKQLIKGLSVMSLKNQVG